MKAVHLRIEDPHDETEAATVEAVARYSAGVKDVASIRSLNMISVLYDDARTDVSRLLANLAHTGFHFNVMAGL